jgi:glycerate kinase
LLGARGAARSYGPQKGASPEAVEELERRLAAAVPLRPFARLPGAGAAGGLGAALASLGASLHPGIEVVLEALRFEEDIGGADLVVTGEGAVDGSSAGGKVPAGVARASARAGIPCVVLGGRVDGGVASLYELGATAVLALGGGPARAREDLAAAAEAVGRLVLRE